MMDNYELLFYRKTSNNYLPDEMVEIWKAVLELVFDGYNDIDQELEYDFLIRNEIEDLINDTELGFFNEHKIFKNKIDFIDDKIRSLVFENPKIDRNLETKWWKFIILKKARDTYVNDIKNIYNIDIGRV